MDEEIQNENLNNQPPAKQIDPAAHEAIKNDMFKYKRQAQEYLEKQEELENRIKEFETNQQKSQGKYKELYETTVSDLNTYKDKYENVLRNVEDDKKLNAVREFALKKNIRSEALDDLDMLDMSSVIVETTDQGRYQVLGADNFVDKIYNAKPHWFKDSTAPGVNNGTGEFDNREKTYSPAELLTLQKSSPSEYKEIITKKRHLIRS